MLSFFYMFSVALKKRTTRQAVEKICQVYSNFTITNGAINYTVFVDFYSGSATDELNYHNSFAFTTKDRDNDKNGGNCAQIKYRGA